MASIVFINCKDQPFVDQIMLGEKRMETRTRNTLGDVCGNYVLIAETGKGKPVVKCMAYLGTPHVVRTRAEWDKKYLHRACIPEGSKYDWQSDTKVKWCYQLMNVIKLKPFTPPEGKRHGRVWMEYEGMVEVL